jgi:hypothetical protein
MQMSPAIFKAFSVTARASRPVFSSSARAADHQRGLGVGHHQQGLEIAQHLAGPPFLGEFHGGAGELPGMLLQLALEELEQGKGIGGAAGEAGQHPVVVEAPNLAGIALHDGVAQRDLTVTADDDLVVTTHGQDGCTTELLHRTAPNRQGRRLYTIIRRVNRTEFKEVLCHARGDGQRRHVRRGYFALRARGCALS